MKFSIIVVSLNAGEELINTVDSILEQTYSDIEIIVKDGFSKDGSIEKLPVNESIKVYQEKDNGIYDAMNQAIAYISGDYVLFLNCGDTFYSKDVLKEISEYIDDNVDNCIYYGDCYTVNRNAFVRYPDMFDDYICCTKTLCHQATIYKTELLKNKGFDTKYKIVADFHYYVRAYVNGIKLIHIPVVIANYLGGGASETYENRKKAMKDADEILREYLGIKRYKAVQRKSFLSGKKIKKIFAGSKRFYKLYSKFAGFVYRMKDKLNGR